MTGYVHKLCPWAGFTGGSLACAPSHLHHRCVMMCVSGVATWLEYSFVLGFGFVQCVNICVYDTWVGLVVGVGAGGSTGFS